MNATLSILLSGAALIMGACGPAETPGADKAVAASTTVAVSDAWCRPTPNGARAGACYVTLTARGGDDRLVSVSTPAAGMAMIHQMSTEGGMMQMSEMEHGLPLPAGRAVTLAPGGTHLMLMQLTGPLVAGTSVPLTLTFSQARAAHVNAIVRQPT